MNRYCNKECEEVGAVCDFCIHFLLYKNKDGINIDGSGWCGLKRKEVDIGDGCKDNFYCEIQWLEDQKNMFKEINGKKK